MGTVAQHEGQVALGAVIVGHHPPHSHGLFCPGADVELIELGDGLGLELAEVSDHSVLRAAFHSGAFGLEMVLGGGGVFKGVDDRLGVLCLGERAERPGWHRQGRGCHIRFAVSGLDLKFLKLPVQVAQMRPPVIGIGDCAAGVLLQRFTHLLVGKLITAGFGCLGLGVRDRLVQ